MPPLLFFILAWPPRKTRAPCIPRRLSLTEPMFLGFFCASDTPPACLGLETLGPEVAQALGAVSVNTSVPTKRNERAQDPLVYGRSGTFAAGETRFGLRSEHGSGNRTQRERGGIRPPLFLWSE